MASKDGTNLARVPSLSERLATSPLRLPLRKRPHPKTDEELKRSLATLDPVIQSPKRKGVKLSYRQLIAKWQQEVEEVVAFIDRHSETCAPRTYTDCHPTDTSFGSDNQRMNLKSSQKLKRKSGTNTLPPVTDLISSEMASTLSNHIASKMEGNIWENEVRSLLARPLSASRYSCREDQLLHSLTSVRYKLNSPVSSPCDKLYPYSYEAHIGQQAVSQVYRKMVYRLDLLAKLRHLAVKIRFLRRFGIPLLHKGFLKRHRAAICIQRQFRRHAQWREHILVPVLKSEVESWIDFAVIRQAARVCIARKVGAYYRRLKRRRYIELQRRVHLYRWEAKTRICLFVHLFWCPEWFRRKRFINACRMKEELEQLTQIQHNVQVEFSIYLKTNYGKAQVKSELARWRSQIQVVSKSKVVDENVDADTKRLRQCFHAFDLDGSGTLDIDEFHLMLSYLRKEYLKGNAKQRSHTNRQVQLPPLTDVQVRRMFEELDKDHDGSVDCQELENWWKRQTPSSSSLAPASSMFLSGGISQLIVQSHGLLFWLLGKKRVLETKFIEKKMMKQATEHAKLEYMISVMKEGLRCSRCGRRCAVKRDLVMHETSCEEESINVDLLDLQKWIREEEISADE